MKKLRQSETGLFVCRIFQFKPLQMSLSCCLLDQGATIFTDDLSCPASVAVATVHQSLKPERDQVAVLACACLYVSFSCCCSLLEITHELFLV